MKKTKIISAIGVLLIALVVAVIAIIKNIDFNQYKGEIAQQVKAATGRDLIIAGDLDLSISLNPRISVNNVTFANAPWGSAPNMMSIKRFAADMSLMPLLSGEIKINQVILEGVEVLAEVDNSGKANWDFATPVPQPKTTPSKQTNDGKNQEDADAQGEVILPVVNSVSLKDVTLIYINAQAGQQYSLKLDTVDLKSGGLSAPLELLAKGNINSQAFSIDGQLGSIGAISSGGMFPVKLDIAALKVNIAINGKLGAPGGVPMADLKLALNGSSLAETLAAAAILEPSLKGLELPVKGAFEVNTAMKLDGPTKISLADLEASVGPLDITGRVGVDLGGIRPALDVAILTDTLDVEALIDKAKSTKAPATTTSSNSTTTTSSAAAQNNSGRVFPADPLPLEGLKAVDAKVTFNANKLIVQGMDITNVSVSLNLKEGRLNVDSVKAVVAGGQINARVVLDATQAKAALKAIVAVDQLDYGQILTQQGLENIATGKVDVDIDVTGSGNSVAQLMAGLNGKTRLQSKDGKIEDGAFDMISSEYFKASDNIGDKTIRCAVIQFNITKGQANTHAFVLEAGGISVLGGGSANLARETLKMRIDPYSTKGSLKSIAMVPVDIFGTFAKPDWKLDMSSAASNIAASAAQTLSSLGKSLLGESKSKTTAPSDNTDYCTPALAGKRITAQSVKAANKAKAAKAAASQKKKTNSTSSTQSKITSTKKKITDTLDSIGKSLGGLFGN